MPPELIKSKLILVLCIQRVSTLKSNFDFYLQSYRKRNGYDMWHSQAATGTKPRLHILCVLPFRCRLESLQNFVQSKRTPQSASFSTFRPSIVLHNQTDMHNARQLYTFKANLNLQQKLARQIPGVCRSSAASSVQNRTATAVLLTVAHRGVALEEARSWGVPRAGS